MYAQTQPMLPVNPEQIDQSCINQNLPNGNDIWPQLQRMPTGIDGQTIQMAVSYFRFFAQSRAGKSRLHIFGYNLLSQNRFQNPTMVQWCQQAVDFTEFLVRAQNNPPQQAAEKAAGKIYMGYLYSLAATPQFAVLQQFPDVQQLAQGLNAAGQELQAITADVQNFQRQMSGMGNSPYASVNVGGSNQLPPIGGGGYNNGAPNMHAQLSAYTVSQPQASAPGSSTAHLMPTPTTAGAANNGATNGRYLDNSQQSWGSNAPQASAQPPVTVVTQTQPAQPVQDEPIPTDLTQIVVDPAMNARLGFEVNPDRPYDLIHNAGGIEIRPAYQSKWKRTVGDDQPYAMLVDPARWIIFHVKWPDGVVKELPVEVESEMEYLCHEINDRLRAQARKPGGKQVMSTRNIVEYNAVPEPIQEVDQRQDRELDEITPVILENLFTCSTDLENEREARNTVIELQKLNPDDPLPAHQYTSVKWHSLDVSSECSAELIAIAKMDDWEKANMALDKLSRTGLLPLRYFRFINERLTNAVNRFLADALSISTIRISDFSEDIVALGPHLAKKRGLEVQQVFEREASAILKRWLCSGFEGDDDAETFGIMDQYINLQLSWSQDEIASLAIENEAVLVSSASHPMVLTVIRDLLTRVSANSDDLLKHTLRLITADGCYYEIIRGRLIANAILLKRERL